MILRRTKAVDAEQSFVNRRRLILTDKSSFQTQEAYKTLRTNVRFSLDGDGCKKFCLTSSLANEGKSTTILNLAISFAESGSRVILLDADMRRPTLARLLIEKANPGLSNLLAGLCTEEEAIHKEVRPNLDVIFSGEIPPNPLALICSPRMKQLLDSLAKRYDYILLDTPPVGVVSDACEVANLTDGVLFLVHQGVTEKDPVLRGLKQLEMSNAKLLGFVLNGASSVNDKKYKRGYRYKYLYRYKYSAETVKAYRADD